MSTNKTTRTIPRRQMLQFSAAAAATIVMPAKWAASKSISPNEKLNIAFMGIGGQGRSNLNGLKNQNVVALCDVDDDRAGDAYEMFPKAKKFYDYRRMFDEMESQIDACVVSTPDHTHFHLASTALKMGKHLYCEKPMAHAVSEVRILTELARQKKLATQLGVQRHTLNNVHRVIEIVQSGVIGEVREVFSRMSGSRGMPEAPKKFPPVPDDLKWDLWLGPAKERPYSPEYCPYKWRFWWDFGTGETGNWGCHILDIPYWALDLDVPTKVSGWGPPVDPQRTPKSLFSKFEFPARGSRPPVTLHWYHSDKPHPLVQERKLPTFGNTLFVGSKGVLACDFSKRKLYPEDKFADFKGTEKTVPDSPGFHNEWVQACKGGQPATCNFDYSGPLTETVLLGNLAYRIGKEFEWDAKAIKAVGCPEAEPHLRPEYREGWKI